MCMCICRSAGWDTIHCGLALAAVLLLGCRQLSPPPQPSTRSRCQWFIHRRTLSVCTAAVDGSYCSSHRAAGCSRLMATPGFACSRVQSSLRHAAVRELIHIYEPVKSNRWRLLRESPSPRTNANYRNYSSIIRARRMFGIQLRELFCCLGRSRRWTKVLLACAVPRGCRDSATKMNRL